MHGEVAMDDNKLTSGSWVAPHYDTITVYNKININL